MKRIVIILVTAFCLTFPLYSYQPIVEPDLDYLPALLDSTITLDLDSIGSLCHLKDRREYTYDTKGNLISAEIDGSNYYHLGIPCYGAHRFLMSYDENGNQIENISYEWDSIINDWVGSWKSNLSYDENGNQIENISYEWDSIINDWVEDDKVIRSYDKNGNQIKFISYHWDSDINDWDENIKVNWSYDENGNQIEKIRVGSWKETWSYDENGNKIEYINYDWNSDINDWVWSWETSKETWSYDENGKPIEYINYDWASDINDWVWSWKEYLSYDENGNQIENISYKWVSGGINDWVEYKKSELVVDENGNQIEKIYYEWDRDINDWVECEKETWSYDENGNQIEKINYYWDSGTNDWAGNLKSVDTYNTNGLITGRIEYEWDPDGEDWSITAEHFAYWSELGAGIPVRKENQQIIVCPNPTNSFLTIESDIPDIYFIKIYSQNGQMVYSAKMEGTTHQLDVSSFQKGIYFITLTSEDFVTTRKIIKL